MKMDIRDQESIALDSQELAQQSFEKFHFTPISYHPSSSPSAGKMSPAVHVSARQADKEHRSPSRDVIPVYFDRNLPAPTTLDSERRKQQALTLIGQEIDVRFASAREMSSASLELYIRGMISWDEYARLAFQPELHPDYDATIGALLGETADPDKPRDFVRLWEERLAYERRYDVVDARQLRASERITIVMRRLAGMTSLRA